MNKMETCMNDHVGTRYCPDPSEFKERGHYMYRWDPNYCRKCGDRYSGLALDCKCTRVNNG